MLFDVYEKPERLAITKDDATHEEQEGVVTLLSKTLDRLEERFSDGRTHVGGAQMTHADFHLLAMVTRHFENTHGKHNYIKEAAATKLHSCPNVMRVVAPMRELCADTISALQPSPS